MNGYKSSTEEKLNEAARRMRDEIFGENREGRDTRTPEEIEQQKKELAKKHDPIHQAEQELVNKKPRT